MDLTAAKTVMTRTHIAALRQSEHSHRANGIYLESGPGVGKSESVFQAAEDLARTLHEPIGVVQFMLATISSVDVRGFMLPVKQAGGAGLDTLFSTPPWFPTRANTHVFEDDGSPDGIWHRPGSVPEGARVGPNDVPRVGILFLDEFGQAEDEVKKPAAELIYKGNVGTSELQPGWRVVAAGNRLSDRSGVMRELMFLVNRRCRLSVDASLPSWLRHVNGLAPARRPHYLSISFAQKNPDVVFKNEVPPGSDPFCTPRTLCLLDKDLMALRSAEDEARGRLPTDAIAREVAAGWIGGAAAAQFFAHLKYADELPEIDDIERHPDKAKLPGPRDAQMVCGYMLAHNINETNAGAFLTYIGRLNIEMQALTIRAISSQGDRLKALVAHPGYVKWLIKNKDLITASQS